MTDTQKETFYEDVLAIVEVNQPTYLELMETFFSIILTQELILEENEDEETE